jgi:hypothetical protein
MEHSLKLKVVMRAVLGLLAAAALPAPVWACSACYGQSDSPLAAGMNWGIFSLLATIVLVLATIAGFFIFLARRSTSDRNPSSSTQHAARNTQHATCTNS